MAKKPRDLLPHEGYDPEWVTDLSVEVYKRRLDDASGGGEGAVKRMLEKDNDGGIKLRSRAEAYNALTRAYLVALKIPKPRGGK